MGTYTGKHRPKTAVEQAAAAVRSTLREQLDAMGLNTHEGRHRPAEPPAFVEFSGSSRLDVAR